jgi:hypothetical protein
VHKYRKNSVSAGRLSLAVAVCLFFCGQAGAAGGGLPSEIPSDPEPLAPDGRSGPIPVHLYFGSPDGAYLISEIRGIDTPADPLRTARAILEALISGPRGDLARTIPAATRLRAIFLATENVCFVDFGSAIRDNHPGGCRGEILTVYSVVNSLIINIPSIKRVKLLIDGNDIDTLAGHLNTQNPIPANMLIIR